MEVQHHIQDDTVCHFSLDTIFDDLELTNSSSTALQISLCVLISAILKNLTDDKLITGSINFYDKTIDNVFELVPTLYTHLGPYNVLRLDKILR